MTSQNFCVLGSLMLLLLFTFIGQSHSEIVKWTLTEDERALIDKVYHAGVLDEAGWARVFERVKYAPRRKDAIYKALYDESIGSRIERDVYRLTVHVSDLRHIIGYFRKHGLSSVLNILIMPLTGFFRVLSGSLGEYPLTTLFQFLLVAYITVWHIRPRVIRYSKKRIESLRQVSKTPTEHDL